MCKEEKTVMQSTAFSFPAINDREEKQDIYSPPNKKNGETNFVMQTLYIRKDYILKLKEAKGIHFRSVKAFLEQIVDKGIREWLEAVEEEEARNGTKEDLH